MLIFFNFIEFITCDPESTSGRKLGYVKPLVDKNGKFRKGHVRMPVSTKRMLLRTRTNQSIILTREGSLGISQRCK